VRISEGEPRVGVSSSVLHRQQKEPWLSVSERVGLRFRSFTRCVGSDGR